MTGLSPRGFLGLTRLRREGCGGASKFIEGASLCKTIQPPCGRRKCTPFGGWRHHLPPGGGTITRAYCRAADEARLQGVLFCPLHRGKSGAARIGGWRAQRASQQNAIGGQDRDGASYRCSAPYTLSRFAGLPLKGKRENRWHWILCYI